MFGFYDDPFDDFFDVFPSRRPRYYYRRPTYVDEYYDAINDRLNRVLAEEFGIGPYNSYHSYPHKNILQRARNLEHQRQLDACDHSQVKEKIEHEVKDEAKKAEEAAPKPINSPYQSMFYESHSSYNGKNYVEEHRERVQDSDGNLHVTTRRRLGDRWYESKSITDGEGKTSTKETWHNVPEDQIDQFKQEWADQHQAKYTPIEHDTKEEAEKTQENAIKKD